MSEIQNTKEVIIKALNSGRLSKIEKISLLNDIIGDIQKHIKKTVVIETISKDDAKEKIKKFVEETDNKFYPDEIAEKLHIEFGLVMEIVHELVNEDIIEVLENGIGN